jgi:formylglycine-generating enzyme required for sulfatase activity
MHDEVKSVLGRWVRKYHWDERVIGTEWTRYPRAARSLWQNGYMAHTRSKDIGFRLVRDTERPCE